ncbi:MAG: hypothetical protein WBA45_01865 [Microthrixaceae bacterium]
MITGSRLRSIRSPPAERTLDRALDELWRIATGPAYAAVLEVVVAARTDDGLRTVVHGVAAGLESTMIELVMRFSPEIADSETARRIVDIAFTFVQGAAVSRIGGFGRPDEVIEFAKSVIGTSCRAPALSRIETSQKEP